MLLLIYILLFFSSPEYFRSNYILNGSTSNTRKLEDYRMIHDIAKKH